MSDIDADKSSLDRLVREIIDSRPKDWRDNVRGFAGAAYRFRIIREARSRAREIISERQAIERANG